MIHCFGDSWVQGIGTEWKPGEGRIPMSDRYDENKDWTPTYEKYSWPGQLKELLGNVELKNYGSAGFSNQDIYKDIMENIWSGNVKKGDFVIVSLSSIIRQPLPFFYTRDDVEGFINYSNSCFIHQVNGIQNETMHWIDSIQNEKLKETSNKVYEDYIKKRFSYNYLYETAMNYICNLQVYFEELEIDYVFLNAFENNLSKDVMFYKDIKLDKWILPNYTLQEYLLDESEDFDTSIGHSVWEDDMIEVERNQDGPHPNRIGYRMIAEYIYEQIKDKKVIQNGSTI